MSEAAEAERQAGIKERKASIVERRKRKRVRVSRVIMQTEEDGKEPEVIQKRSEITLSDEEAEARQLVTQLARTYATSVNHYLDFYGVSFEDVEKAKQAELAKKSAEENQEFFRRKALEKPLHEVTWRDISAVGHEDMQAALTLWWRLRNWATDELETGGRSGKIFGEATPQERARFLAIRDGFMDAWSPQNQFELTLVDMLAQLYSSFLYWSQMAHERAVEAQLRDERENSRRYQRGWKTPYQSEADAIEQAHRLADSYNRQFLRVMRQFRDLRRYTPPVIVNNGGQVNVANQQVNVTRPD